MTSSKKLSVGIRLHDDYRFYVTERYFHHKTSYEIGKSYTTDYDIGGNFIAGYEFDKTYAAGFDIFDIYPYDDDDYPSVDDILDEMAAKDKLKKNKGCGGCTGGSIILRPGSGCGSGCDSDSDKDCSGGDCSDNDCSERKCCGRDEEVLSCKVCRYPHPYAKPNQPDGTLICYKCRNNV